MKQKIQKVLCEICAYCDPSVTAFIQQEYNQHIQDLKDEMDESSKSAEMIVQEMSAFKNRHVLVTWDDSCAACELKLLLRAFYIFPCSHHFHMDCLQDVVLPILNPSIKQRYKTALPRKLRHARAANTLET